MRLEHLFPQARSRSLRVVLLGVAALSLWMLVREVQDVVSGNYYGIPFATVILVASAGLWRLTAWARVFALILLWLFLFSLPFGEMSVMSAMDGLEPPIRAWDQFVRYVGPQGVVAALVIEMLGVFRNEFGRERSIPSAPADVKLEYYWPRFPLLWIAAVAGAPSLIVLLLERGVRHHGGCISANPSVGPEWTYPALVGVGLGTALFVIATPRGATRVRTVIRAAVCAAALLWFWSCAHGYVWYQTIC